MRVFFPELEGGLEGGIRFILGILEVVFNLKLRACPELRSQPLVVGTCECGFSLELTVV